MQWATGAAESIPLRWIPSRTLLQGSRVSSQAMVKARFECRVRRHESSKVRAHNLKPLEDVGSSVEVRVRINFRMSAAAWRWEWAPP